VPQAITTGKCPRELQEGKKRTPKKKKKRLRKEALQRDRFGSKLENLPVEVVDLVPNVCSMQRK